MRRVLMVLIGVICLVGGLAGAQERAYWPTESWRTQLPEEQGLDRAALDSALEMLQEELPFVNSLLVVREGVVILEEYYNDYDAESLHLLWSVTKSFMSALIGIAIERGDIESVDDPIVDYFPDYFVDIDDAQKREITLRDLLMMRSGFDWHEGLTIGLWFVERDQIEFILNRDLLVEPGERWNYSTGNSHLLSAALTQATGKSAAEYAAEHLFGPLGIVDYEWTTDAAGINIGGAELRLTTRDMAKFGFLYLNQGRWEDQQIVPEEWVQLTTAPESTQFYGYHWWVNPIEGSRSFAAEGYAGQNIVVLPELDIVIAVTSQSAGLFGTASQQSREVRDFLSEVLFPLLSD